MKILQASKYQDVTKGRVAAANATPFQVLVRKHKKQQGLREWFATEMKEGRFLHRYIAKEKALAERRWKAVARKMHGWKQNNKSELKTVAHVPLRDWIRMKREDADFWNDDSNLRSLKRDVPHAAIYI